MAIIQEQERDPSLLRSAMSETSWSGKPTPIMSESEGQFFTAIQGYIQTEFSPDAPMEDIYQKLIGKDLQEQIDAYPESLQQRVKHIIYLATVNARNTDDSVLQQSER